MKITLSKDDLLTLDELLGTNELKKFNSKQLDIITNFVNNDEFLSLSDLTMFLMEVDECVPAVWDAE